MSDLSRLCKQLANLERSGRRLSADIAEIQESDSVQAGAMTRHQERTLAYLNRLRDERRKEWRAVYDALQREEKRLLTQPDAFLRFT